MSRPQSNAYAIPSIAAAYGLAFVPNYYGTIRMMVATGGKWSFAMPRTNMDTLKSKVPNSIWGQCYRARCAHVNSLEGFPIFAAAMLAGTMTHLPKEELNQSAAWYLGLRSLYSVLYISTTSEVFALARSGIWGASIAVPFWTLWRAGKMEGL